MNCMNILVTLNSVFVSFASFHIVGDCIGKKDAMWSHYKDGKCC